jgi:DNA-binding LacI/PurR family transcriptional regulator
VRELGYVPNLAARNLARGSNRLIGVFTYLPIFPYASRDFYHDFLMGIEEAAEQLQYNLLLITGAKNDRGGRSVYAGGVNNLQLADGAVLLGSGEDEDELARMVADGYPFVYIGQRNPAAVDISYVGADYAGGTRSIVEELAGLGHRRIGLVRDAGPGEPVPARRPGFLAGCREAGLAAADRPLYTLGSERTRDRGVRAFADAPSLLADVQRRRVTALVVERGTDAVVLLDVARAAGLRVPEDLSVVCLGVPPDPGREGLARLVIPRREMGRQAVEVLLGVLGGEGVAPVQRTLPCGLDRGRTFAAPA